MIGLAPAADGSIPPSEAARATISEEAVIVKTLAILPSRPDQIALSEIFRHSRWHLYIVPDLRSMHQVVHGLAPSVVLCDASPPGGGWREVLRELEHLASPPPLMVCSRLADDRLWAEVLNLGGYDVLAMPFQHEEVRRAVCLACRNCRT